MTPPALSHGLVTLAAKWKTGVGFPAHLRAQLPASLCVLAAHSKRGASVVSGTCQDPYPGEVETRFKLFDSVYPVWPRRTVSEREQDLWTACVFRFTLRPSEKPVHRALHLGALSGSTRPVI